ncbi:hypothetical protein Tco_1529631 [Tanacetum coccineum]
MRILSVVNVKINKKLGYGYLEEIVVRRSDKKLYTFKEGDFKNLHLNDIEDMLILHVQNRLSNLGAMTLCRKLPKEAQHYQATIRLYEGISFKEPYTTRSDPKGVVYEDKSKRKRLMRDDELYKFYNGTLKSVRNILYERVQNFKVGYNKGMPRRKWTIKDQNQSHIMVNLIDNQLRERRIIESLEGLVGARKVETCRLLRRTI